MRKLRWYHDLWRHGLYLGVDSSSPSHIERCVVMTNFVAIAGCLTILLFALTFLLFDLPALSIFCLVFMATTGYTLYCNAKRRYFFARFSLIIGASIMGLFLLRLVGRSAGLHTGYMILAGAPILMFDRQERWFKFSTGIALAVPLICYFIANHFFEDGWYVTLNPAHTRIIGTIANCAYFQILFLEMYYLYSLTSRMQVALSETNADLRTHMQETLSATEAKERAHAAAFTSSRMAAIGELAGSIAHEINTPLAVIDARARHARLALEREPCDCTQALHFVGIIAVTAKRMAEIVWKIRDFSRNAEDDHFQTTSVAEIIANTIDVCQERFINSGIKLLAPKIPGTMTCECRKSQVSQVLLHLLNNAFDAVLVTENKIVEISCKELDQMVVISVTDSGSGIDPAINERIFEPFFTTKDVNRRSGLGLTIARQAVVSHGGTLDFKTNGGNTEFIVSLPKRHAS